MGVTFSTVNQWENGRRRPQPFLLKRLLEMEAARVEGSASRLALGKTVREIAEAYHLSSKTVDTYRYRLLKKLNLRNNAEISRFAIQNRLVEF